MNPGGLIAGAASLMLGLPALVVAGPAALDFAATSYAQYFGYSAATAGGSGSLGSYPGYIDAASAIGANAFDIGWQYSFLNALGGYAYTANQQFLTTSMEMGQQIFMSTDWNGDLVGAGFAWEQMVLTMSGFGPSTWSMVPTP